LPGELDAGQSAGLSVYEAEGLEQFVTVDGVADWVQAG